MAARRLTTLLAALAVAAFLVFALRPACDLLPGHAVKHGNAVASLDLASPDPGGKALGAAPALASYLVGAMSLLGGALLSRSAPLRLRPFYARSSRILR